MVSPPWPGLLVGDQIILRAGHFGNWDSLGGARCCYAVCWAEFLLGSGPIGDPGFMNPTGAPEPFWDFYEVMKGLFILVLRAHPVGLSLWVVIE